MGKRTKDKKNQEPGLSSAPMAGWFNKQLTRRTVGKGLAWTAVLGAAGVSIYKVSSDDDSEISADSLELQKKEGWNVGSTDKLLVFNEGLSAIDSVQKTWSGLDPNYLISIYQPRSSALQPFFVPTLIQSLAQPSLNAQIRPINTALMNDCYQRTEGLRNLLSQTADAGQSLIVCDLPGPASVAVGAAMSDIAQVIPAFDNWPHPLGVVRSHETLGAMVYYAHEIEQKKSGLPDNAPMMILLDSNRLTPYTNQDNQFDNRYLAKLPTADQLKQRGIKQVLYLVKDQLQTEELDDLNEEFVDWQKNGLATRMLRLSDFKPFDEPVIASKGSSAGATGDSTQVHRHYYYGGSPYSHWWFYSHYYYSTPRQVVVVQGGRSVPLPRPSTAPSFSPPSYRPVTRPTIFSAARVGSSSGIGKTRPSGFGRTSVRVAQNGRVTGTRPGRSGSYGRSGGSWFSG
ncbi:MAG: hypothetical protein IPO77_05950 [Acidobacteria bacterium]|nr:hypothetical protein [Acidobacteriota bacterium]